MYTLIKNSLANLREHKLRLIIAFIWIIIGITSVVFVSSMGNAISALFKSSFQTIAPRTAIIYFQPSDEELGTNQVLLDPFANSDVEILKTLDGIKDVKGSTTALKLSPSLYQDDTFYADMSYFNKNSNGPVYPIKGSHYKVIKGRALTSGDEGRKVIVLEKSVSKDLFKKSNPIGKAISINNLNYEVVGINDGDYVYDPVEKKFNKRTDFDSTLPFSTVPNNTYDIMTGKSFKKGAINNIIITVSEGFETKEVTETAMSELMSLHPNIMGEYKIQDQSSIQKSTEAMTKGIDKFVTIITVVAMIVGGVGIMNIMYVSVMERNKEIGIRRALGAKPKTILLQFLIESVFITSIGGVLGIIVGYAVTLYSRNILPFKPIPSFNSFLYSFVAIVLTGIIFGIVPAYKASKVDPIKIIYK